LELFKFGVQVQKSFSNDLKAWPQGYENLENEFNLAEMSDHAQMMQFSYKCVHR